MRGVNGWSGWQWLFLIEAIITFIVGLFSWVLMPPGPCQTKNWFRGKEGWFTDREETILVNRLLRDDPSKGDMVGASFLSARILLASFRKQYSIVSPVILILGRTTARVSG